MTNKVPFVNDKPGWPYLLIEFNIKSRLVLREMDRLVTENKDDVSHIKPIQRWVITLCNHQIHVEEIENGANYDINIRCTVGREMHVRTDKMHDK